MGIWHKEIIRVDGELKCFVKIQNEYTGQITEGLRNIFLKDDRYYCRADGREIKLNDDITKFKMNEDNIKSALEWYKKTKF